MRKPLIDSSLSNDEKIKKLSKLVERLGRRSVKTAKAIITPYPISNCVISEEVKGEVLKYMFCCSGTVTRGKIWLNAKPKKGAAIVITIENDIGSRAASYNILRRDLLMEPNIKVQSGDRLTVSFHTIDPEEDKISECWIGFMWVPDVNETEVKQYLLDEIESIVPEE